MSDESQKTKEEEIKGSKESEAEVDKEKSATIADVERIVGDAMSAIKTIVVGGDKKDKAEGEDGEKKSGDTEGRRSSRLSLRDVEERAEALVSAAAEKVFSRSEAAAEAKAAEKKVEKKETEKAPVHRRKSTSFWLGKYGEE